MKCKRRPNANARKLFFSISCVGVCVTVVHTCIYLRLYSICVARVNQAVVVEEEEKVVVVIVLLALVIRGVLSVIVVVAVVAAVVVVKVMVLVLKQYY